MALYRHMMTGSTEIVWQLVLSANSISNGSSKLLWYLCLTGKYGPATILCSGAHMLDHHGKLKWHNIESWPVLQVAIDWRHPEKKNWFPANMTWMSTTWTWLRMSSSLAPVLAWQWLGAQWPGQTWWGFSNSLIKIRPANSASTMASLRHTLPKLAWLEQSIQTLVCFVLHIKTHNTI